MAKAVGRPKTNFKEPAKSSQLGTKEGEERATFIVKTDLLEKLKYISFWSKKKNKEVVNEAFEEYVSKWEKKNGEIPKR